jgi:hypothetical protein
LSGEQTVDGIALVDGDRVLCKDQTDATENGVYVVSTGAWTRAVDFDGSYDITEGTIIPVSRGTVNADTEFRISNTGTITIGTTSLTFEARGASDSSNQTFLQAGTGAVSRTTQAKLRDTVSVLDFGAVGDGVTDDSASIQSALDHIKNGGQLDFPYATYRCDTALTFQSDGTTPKSAVINFNGSSLDFSASGITSGALFTIGATAIANAHDQELVTLSNLSILGPEPALTTTNTTTVIGLSMDNCLRHLLLNIVIQNCYTGFKTESTWDLQTNSCCARECYIGLLIDDESTYATHFAFQAVDNRYGVVIKPATSGLAVFQQTFIGARLEGCDVGAVLDPGTNASFGIDSVQFLNTYAENNTYDLFREGLQWTFANPGTRNSDSVGFCLNTKIDGGSWSGMGAWTGTHAPLVLPSSGTQVRGGYYRIPALRSEVVGNMRKSVFIGLIDLTLGLGTDIEYEMPGDGRCAFAGATGSISTQNSQIASVSRISTGIYDIGFTEAYASTNDMIPSAIVSETGFAFTVNASMTTTNCRIQVVSDGGTVYDPTVVRFSVCGKLA